MAYIAPDADVKKAFSGTNFQPGVIHPGFIPIDRIPQQILLRFNLSNDGDSVKSVWFFPGLYYNSIEMYRVNTEGALEKMPDILPKTIREISYRLIELQAGESAQLLAVLKPVHTHLNQIRPRLIAPEFLKTFVIELDNTNIESKIFTYVFCGLLLMMILFSMANYFLGKNLEFFYYSGYAFLIGMMLFIKGIYSYHSSKFGFYQEGYLDFIMQSLGTICYMRFMQKYLYTKKDHRFLHRLYNIGIVFVVLALIAFTYVHYFTWNFVLENYIENITKGILLVMTFIFLVYSFRRWDDHLLRYLFWGNLSLFVFSLLSLLLLTGTIVTQNMPAIFRSSLFYYEMGILLELIFFLMGLNFKNRRNLIAQARERERLKAENLMNEYEREIAVYKGQQEERQRISADMHDELGSGMTAIRLMSEIARNKMKENTPVEIEKISRSADEVLNKMNAIIWSMNSGNDSVDNLVSYIRAYALEYFEGTHISCKIFTPENINQRELTGDKRRNLFLCVKETLNNALKHSKANEIRIYFVTDDVLTIRIVDNGIGIDMEKLREFGNGLKNIAKRMESIGGTYHVENNGGTVTTLRLKL
ncbi:MAG: histidine kinase [Chitinophagaceae bacterium]|nr:histidine kinase [Chitinophagaceae bacterium]